MGEKGPSKSAVYTGLIILGVTFVLTIIMIFTFSSGTEFIGGHRFKEEDGGDSEYCLYNANTKGTLHIYYSFGEPWSPGHDERVDPTLTCIVTDPDGNTLPISSDSWSFFEKKVTIRKPGEYRITIEISDSYYHIRAYALFTTNLSSGSCCFLCCGLPILISVSISLFISGLIQYFRQKRRSRKRK